MTALKAGVRRSAVVGLLLASASCGSGARPAGEPSAPEGEPSQPSGPCNAVTRSFEVHSALHVADCSVLPDVSVPPAGGDHYESWAAFQSYDFPVPYGYLVHCMEHGAVVFYYNCPGDCADQVEVLKHWLDGQPEDPLCLGTGAPRRVVLTPDPNLDVRWALSAWGHTLRADCFDPDLFSQFYLAHYGQGPEQLCSPGVAFSEPPCQ